MKNIIIILVLLITTFSCNVNKSEKFIYKQDAEELMYKMQKLPIQKFDSLYSQEVLDVRNLQLSSIERDGVVFYFQKIKTDTIFVNLDYVKNIDIYKLGDVREVVAKCDTYNKNIYLNASLITLSKDNFNNKK